MLMALGASSSPTGAAASVTPKGHPGHVIALPAHEGADEPSSLLPPVWRQVDHPFVVTIGTGAKLVASYWKLRDEAIYYQPHLLTLVETGPALAIDEPSCGCGVPYFGPMLAESVFVTPQKAFPAYFMAEVASSSGEWKHAVTTLVFERLSASVSWQVVIAGATDQAGSKPARQWLDWPGGNAEGFDVSPMIHFPGGLASLPGDLAAYWNYWAAHKKGPAASMFWPGPFTDQRGAEIAEDETSGHSGTVYRYQYTAGASSNAWAEPRAGVGHHMRQHHRHVHCPQPPCARLAKRQAHRLPTGA